MISRYCSVSSLFNAFVAAAAMDWPTAVSAMPRIWEISTLISAGSIWSDSLLEKEVARAEKSSGMVTAAEYFPDISPSAASCWSVSTQVKLLSVDASPPLTRPPASCRPSGTSCPLSFTGSSRLITAASTLSRRESESQVAHRKPPATSSGTSTKPTNESQVTREDMLACSKENIIIFSSGALAPGRDGYRAQGQTEVAVRDQVGDRIAIPHGQNHGRRRLAHNEVIEQAGQGRPVIYVGHRVSMIDEDNLGVPALDRAELSAERAAIGPVDHRGAAAYRRRLLGQHATGYLHRPRHQLHPPSQREQQRALARPGRSVHHQHLARPKADRNLVRAIMQPKPGHGDDAIIVRRRPAGKADLVRQPFSLDVKGWQPSVHPPRQPPGPPAEQRQNRGHQCHPDCEGIDGHPHGQTEGDRLDRTLTLGHEGGKDCEHDQRRRNYDPSGGGETILNRAPSLAAMDVLLPDP